MRARSPSLSVLALGLALVACAGAPPPDLLNGPAYAGRGWGSETEGAAVAQTTVTGAPGAGKESANRRVLVRGTVHVLASDGDEIYYGDEDQNALMAVPARGGRARLVGSPAPLALALSERHVVWIGRPGNAIFRAARGRAGADRLGSPGSFTTIAAAGKDVVVGEDIATGGAVTRFGGGGAVVRLATFDSRPRAVALDEEHVYVASGSELVRIARAGGARQQLASGRNFAALHVDRDYVYAAAPTPLGRAVVRVPKRGGPAVEVVATPSEGPLTLQSGALYFVAPQRSELLRVPAAGGAPVVVARDEAFTTVTAIAADRRAIYVGTVDAGLLALPLR
jgi:hypothetical protein